MKLIAKAILKTKIRPLIFIAILLKFFLRILKSGLKCYNNDDYNIIQLLKLADALFLTIAERSFMNNPPK